QLTEVRSATQPLGSPERLQRARLASRLGEVNAGFQLLADGAGQLRNGLTEGAAKLRAAIWLEATTGLALTGKPGTTSQPKSDPEVTRAHTRETLATSLKQASAALQWSPGVPATWNLPALGEAFKAMGESRKSPDRKGAARIENAAQASAGRATGRP